MEGMDALGAAGDGLTDLTVLGVPPKGRAVLLYALLPGARLAGVLMGTGFMISSGSSLGVSVLVALEDLSSERFRFPVQALILFCASRCVIPSVAMPSIDSTTSPTLILALAAFPPSVSLEMVRGMLKSLPPCSLKPQGEGPVKDTL